MSHKQDKTETTTFSYALLHPRYWLTWLFILFFYLLTFLPVSILDKLGVLLGNQLSRINQKRFNVVKTNLTLCFPDRSENEINAMVIRHFQYLMRGLMHYGLIWWASEKRLNRHLKLDGFDLVHQHRQQGDNVILLLSHCTGLEFAVAAITQEFPSSGPYKPLSNAVIDYFIAKGRERFGCLTFTRDDGLRPLIKFAREGRVIIYLADEDLGPDVSVFAPFFGVKKATIPLLGRLAKSCKAKVLPCISCYDEPAHQYQVKVLPALDNYPAGDAQQDAALMNQMIENTVRLCPEQYFWTLKLFKTRPPGEDKIYP